jgi:hypothetical protein
MLRNIRISGLRGIVNTRDPDELIAWDAVQKGVATLGLVDAVNGDITPQGKWRRRHGWKKLSSTGFVTAFSTRDFQRAYGVTAAGTLVRIWPDATLDVLASGLSTVQGDWVEVGSQVFYLNGTDYYVIMGSTARPWGIPVCPQPTLRAAAGNLPAGRYQVALTYMAADGREGGALAATTITLDDGSAIAVDDITQLPGYQVNVYVGSTDAHAAEGDSWKSGMVYWATATTSTSVTWNGPITTLVDPILTQFFVPPGALGSAVGDFWRGRMWVGASYPDRAISVVYGSEEMGLEWFDPQKAMLAVPGAVNMLASVPEALIVGTDLGVWAWDEQGLTRLCNYGSVPGRNADREDDGNIVRFWTTRGLCQVMPFQNLTEQNLSIEPGVTANGRAIERDGFKRYMLLIQPSKLQAYNAYQTQGGVFGEWDLVSAAGRLTGTIRPQETFEPTGFELVMGTTSDGLPELTDLDDSLFTVAEQTMAPGFDFRTTFDNVDIRVCTLSIDGYYAGNAGHVVQVQAYNFTLADWDVFGLLPDATEQATYDFQLTADNRSGDQVLARIYHVSPGNTNHRLYLDRIRLME